MKKLHWGWRIGILYTTFAIGTMTWVTYAMTKEVDLVRDDYYEHSLQENQTMAARANAAKLGPEASIVFDRSAKVITVNVPGTQVPTATGKVTLYHASTLHDDNWLPLTPDPSGRMVIPMAKLPVGVWRVSAEWSSNGKSYLLEQKDTLK